MRQGGKVNGLAGQGQADLPDKRIQVGQSGKDRIIRDSRYAVSLQGGQKDNRNPPAGSGRRSRQRRPNHPG